MITIAVVLLIFFYSISGTKSLVLDMFKCLNSFFYDDLTLIWFLICEHQVSMFDSWLVIRKQYYSALLCIWYYLNYNVVQIYNATQPGPFSSQLTPTIPSKLRHILYSVSIFRVLWRISPNEVNSRKPLHIFVTRLPNLNEKILRNVKYLLECF